MMRIVCHDALVAAEQLGLDTDSLQREAVALAEQEQKVIAITDHMERRETDYREKGESQTLREVCIADHSCSNQRFGRNKTRCCALRQEARSTGRILIPISIRYCTTTLHII